MPESMTPNLGYVALGCGTGIEISNPWSSTSIVLVQAGSSASVSWIGGRIARTRGCACSELRAASCRSGFRSASADLTAGVASPELRPIPLSTMARVSLRVSCSSRTGVRPISVAMNVRAPCPRPRRSCSRLAKRARRPVTSSVISRLSGVSKSSI